MLANIREIDREDVMGAVKTDGTVGKALDVLDQVAAFGRPARFSELLAQSDFPKPTLYRLLQTLTSQGMLGYDPERQTYAPGVRLVRLAHAAWSQASLAPIARTHIDRLAASVDEAVHLAQIDNGQVLFIDKRQTSQKFATLAQAGQVAPAYCTGVGKVILAYLAPERRARAIQQQAFLKYTPATHDSAESLDRELNVIRVEGIAYDREEHDRGIISIAAPILTSGDRVVGALSIATSTSRYSLKELDKFRPALLEVASHIGMDAQSWQFPSQT